MPNSPNATWVPAKRVANDSPPWYLAAPFLLFLVSAGMGEWKTINNVLSGLPKAITLGIIALAVAYAFIRPILSVCVSCSADRLIPFFCGGASLLVSDHMDLKLHRASLHDPRLLENAVSEHFHLIGRRGGIPVR